MKQLRYNCSQETKDTIIKDLTNQETKDTIIKDLIVIKKLRSNCSQETKHTIIKDLTVIKKLKILLLKI